MTVTLTAAAGSKTSTFSAEISKDHVIQDNLLHKLAARRLIK